MENFISKTYNNTNKKRKQNNRSTDEKKMDENLIKLFIPFSNSKLKYGQCNQNEKKV